MRPLFLSIDGLACYAREQTIDFAGEGLELFAITGPTGAGKSSLLDAMLFALYGQVPRVDGRHVTEMIAAARDRMSVRLDFALGGERYRITRTRRRSGSTTVRLEQQEGEEFSKNLADSVRAANARVEELLRLDIDAFKQAVVLPQGEFAAFLKSKPATRQDMLQKLLRLEVYERMRKRAHETARRRAGEVKSLRERLAEDFGGVSEEALKKIQKERDKVVADTEKLRRQREREQGKLDDIRARREKTEALEAAIKRTEQLNQQAAEIEDLAAAAAAAERAAALRSPIRELAQAEVALKDAEAAAVAAQRNREQLEKVRAKTEKGLEKARRSAAEIPALRQREAELNQAVARLPERDRLRRTLEEKQGHRRDERAALETLERRRSKASEKAAKHRAEAARARESKAAARFDPEAATALEAVRESAGNLRHARADLAAARTDAAKKKEAADKAAAAAGRAAVAAARASEASTAAESRFKAAQGALHQAHREHAAASLRPALKPGQPCPVCEQIVERLPAAELHPEVEARLAEVDAAERERDRARQAAAAHRDEATRQQEAAATAAKAAAEAAKKAGDIQLRVASGEAAIREALGARLPGGEDLVDVWVEAELERLNLARRDSEQADKKLAQAEQQRAEAEAEAAAAAGLAEEKTNALRRLDEEVSGVEETLNQLVAAIAKVSDDPDPAAEVERIKGRVKRTEGNLKAAEVEAQQTEVDLATSRETEKEKAAALAAAQRAQKGRRTALDRGLEEAGFADGSAAEKALRSPEELARLREQVEAHGRELHAAAQSVAGLEKELGEGRVKPKALADAEETFSKLASRLEDTIKRSGELDRQVEETRGRLGQAANLRRQLEEAEAALAIHDHLASDLGSQRFQAYVLEEAFTDLVRGASGRLRGLTGDRYSLRYAPPKAGKGKKNAEKMILVTDHDNADETRISDTLSGGETFLASLSLALELSDQVQRAAGAVRLDSLFIDEGFGTLDPETLQVVGDAIQNLPVGGRMVGIITHIPELRDEFTQRVVVKPGQGSSTIEVVRGGVLA